MVNYTALSSELVKRLQVLNEKALKVTLTDNQKDQVVEELFNVNHDMMFGDLESASRRIQFVEGLFGIQQKRSKYLEKKYALCGLFQEVKTNKDGTIRLFNTIEEVMEAADEDYCIVDVIYQVKTKVE